MSVRLLLTAACLLSLAACTEKPQDMGSAGKDHTPAYRGTDTAYQAPGWKPGDEKSWDAQIKERAKGQDEYKRIGGAG